MTVEVPREVCVAVAAWIDLVTAWIGCGHQLPGIWQLSATLPPRLQRASLMATHSLTSSFAQQPHSQQQRPVASRCSHAQAEQRAERPSLAPQRPENARAKARRATLPPYCPSASLRSRRRQEPSSNETAGRGRSPGPQTSRSAAGSRSKRPPHQRARK